MLPLLDLFIPEAALEFNGSLLHGAVTGASLLSRARGGDESPGMVRYRNCSIPFTFT
ncbi:MAG: hypothetical protein KAX38_06115 [Candidatus Krumholzibacteria bacterium]|nr:hypothetical protein [Candidatus Krumholzibacteria bacterium]